MISRFLNQILASSHNLQSRFQRFFSGVATYMQPAVRNTVELTMNGLRWVSDLVRPVQYRFRHMTQQVIFWLNDHGLRIPALPELPHPAALDWASFVPQSARLTIHGKMIAAVASILILGLVVGMLPSATNIALGAYSTSTTDADGNAHLGSNTVNDTFYYDRSTDSGADAQQQLGVDPNWANGVSRRSYALSFDGTTSKGYVTTGTNIPDVKESLTLEGWVMATGNNATATNKGIFGKWSSTNDRGYGFYIEGGTGEIQYYQQFLSGGVTSVLDSNTTLTTGVWTHIAATFQADPGATTGTGKLYVNGVLKASSSSLNTSTFVSTVPMTFGRFYPDVDGNYYTGVIDEVRLSSAVRYDGTSVGTSYFVPDRRYKEDNSTVGLWHFDEGVGATSGSSKTYDSSVYGNDGTLNCAATSCVPPKWVTGANAVMDGYDGANGYQTASGAGNIALSDRSSDSSDNAYELKTTGSNAVSVGSGGFVHVNVGNGSSSIAYQNLTQWTVEGWVYPPSTSGTYTIWEQRNFSSSSAPLANVDIVNGQLRAYAFQSNLSTQVTATGSVSANTWVHFAALFDKTNGKIQLYLNGTLAQESSWPTQDGRSEASAGGQFKVVGASLSHATPFNGRIDEIRFSNSLRYGGSFTPSRRFATDANTKLLLHFDETSASFTDSSGSGFNATGTSTTAVEGIYSSMTTDTSAQNWALPGYSYRKQVSVTANANADAGYTVESTADRGAAISNKQTQADGKDWRMMYQPSDATRSLQFDGINDIVTIPDSSSFYLNNKYTIEFWIKPTAYPSSSVSAGIVSQFGQALTGYASWRTALLNTGAVYMANYNGSTSGSLSGTTALPLNKWSHVAMIWTGGTTGTNGYIYVNGALDASGTISAAPQDSSQYSVWMGHDPEGQDYLAAYLDEVRVSNATRYTGAFTPSRNPFASDSSTVGLWHLDEGAGETIVDASSNANNGYLGSSVSDTTANATWSTDGAISTTQEVPRFIPRGNAVNFDGSQYVDLGSVAGSTVATTELWVKPDGTDYVNSQTAIGTSALQGYGGSNRFTIGLKNTGNCPDGSWNMFIGSGTISPDTYQVVCAGSSEIYNATNFPSTSWTHLAVTYDGTTIRMFRNGNLVKTATQTMASGTSTSTLALGKHGGYDGGYYKGMIDEVRISNTVRYTKSFTPQTTPFGVDANTLVLLHLDETGTTVNDEKGTVSGSFGGVNPIAAVMRVVNGGKVDSANQTRFKLVAPLSSGTSEKGYYLYYGNPNEQTSAQSYDSYGVQFDGSDDYINISTDSGANTSLNPGTGSYSFSLWYKAGTTSQFAPIVTKRYSTGTLSVMGLYQGSSCTSGTAASNLCFITNNSPGGGNNQAMTVVSSVGIDTNWHHIVASFTNATGTSQVAKIYIDGVDRTGSVEQTFNGSGGNINISNDGPMRIGWDGASSKLNGSVDDVRYYKRALSSAEAVQLYSNAPMASGNNLTGWWKLDNTSAASTTVADSSGNGYSGTLTNANFTIASNWIVTGSLKAVTAPTVSTVSTAEQESPTFFEYRAFTPATGAWTSDRTKVFQLTTGEQQLGSTGVYVSFNPQGIYSKEDHYMISSWAIEAYASGSTRGRKRGFPAKANLVATGSGLDIIDATTNKLWMRYTTSSTSDMIPVAPTSVVAADGRIYLASGSSGLIALQFDLDDAHRFTGGSVGGGNASYGGNIADRNDDSAYATNAGLALDAYNTTLTVNDVSVATVNNKHIVASAQSNGVSVIVNATAFDTNTTSPSGAYINDYYRSTSINGTPNDYKDVVVTNGGEVYASNWQDLTTPLGIDRWDDVHLDTSDQALSADRSYGTTGTGPNIRSKSVNDLSVTVGTSSADSGASNTIAVAHSLGIDVIQEHSTQASGTIRYYSNSGNAGTSGWSSKQFGGALSLGGTGIGAAYANATGATGSPFNFNFTDSFTLEAWIKTTQTSTAVIMSKYECSGNYGYNLMVNGGKLYADVQPTTSATHYLGRTGSVTINDGTWHHVAATYTGSASGVIPFSSIQLYVDGIQETGNNFATGAGGNPIAGTSSMITTRSFKIGSRGCNIVDFNGLIDEARVSNTVRYTGNFTPSATPFTSGTGTVGLWHFDETSGTTLGDSAAGATSYDATIAGSLQIWNLESPSIGGASSNVTAVGMTTLNNSASGRTLWAGTDTTSGALTAISLTSGRQIRSMTTANSSLPSNGISSLSLSSAGLALVGTASSGAWNLGLAGFVVDDTAATPATVQDPVRVKSGGTVRVKSGGTVRVAPKQ